MTDNDDKLIETVNHLLYRYDADNSFGVREFAAELRKQMAAQAPGSKLNSEEAARSLAEIRVNYAVFGGDDSESETLRRAEEFDRTIAQVRDTGYEKAVEILQELREGDKVRDRLMGMSPFALLTEALAEVQKARYAE